MAEPKRRRPEVDWTNAWREVHGLLWARRKRLALGFLLLVVSRLSGLVLPATTKFLIDDVIGRQRADMLLPLALVAGGATLLQAATGFGLALILGVAAQRSINDLRLRVQRHVGRLPVSYYENHKSGELISRIMNDAEGLRSLVGTGFVQVIGGLLSSTVALGVLLWLNWRLTLLTVVLLAIFAAVMVTGFSRLRPLFRERGRLIAALTARLAESLSGVRVVKAYTAEKREERLFAKEAHRLLRNIVRTVTGVALISSLSGLFFGLAGVMMSVAGARAVLAGGMTVGDVFMFFVFTGLMVAPLIQLTNIGTQVTAAFAGLDRIREVLAERPEDADADQRRKLGPVRGDVAFKSVRFAYDPEKQVLRDVSFEAAAGTTTALVGPSGAGKSTIISLVMAFRHPQSGSVTVDGQDLADVRISDYRSQLAVVLQDDFLFDGTIAENIAYSEPRAPRDAVENAGRTARCDEFVERFPDGYDTVIGERGVKLSGGQRQRVTIARAILADPHILILDEATSSLDSESEALIQDGLRAMMRGRTSFVIAHRLSTIGNADQILVIDDGAIVERGRHAALLERDGLYRRLHDRQYRLEADQFINPGEDFTREPSRSVATPREDSREDSREDGLPPIRRHPDSDD